LKKYAEATLGSGNLKQAVQLPEGEDLNEWLAVNSTEKSVLVLLLLIWLQPWISSIRLTCFTEPSQSSARRVIARSCQQDPSKIESSSIPFHPWFRFFPRYEYHWADGTQVKKAIKVSAPEYVDYLMTWVQGQLDDETIFPSKIGK
jgi:MOB kinase activator 1